jgi:hypothetical protein
MEANVVINDKEVKPSSSVRILGVRIDSTLKWQAQLKAVDAYAMRMLTALKLITGSTWGTSTTAALRVYTTMVRPAVRYGVNT